jgi:hypothetical protein
MCGAVHLLPQYAFMACVGMTSTLPLLLPLPLPLPLLLPSYIYIQE